MTTAMLDAIGRRIRTMLGPEVPVAFSLPDGVSYQQVTAYIASELAKQGIKDAYVSDLYEDACVYCVYGQNGPATYYKRGYTLDGTDVIFTSEPIAVIQRTIYEPVAAEAYSEEPFQVFLDVPQAFIAAEAPDWIPFLPKPGQYKHPTYGDIDLTRESNEERVASVKNRVYQEHIPLDAEHQTKLSGAVGYLRDLKMNDDGSADANIEWSERGKKLMEGGGFRYVSPEWFRTWRDPATGEEHRNVIAGGAITTRPFFKEKALRALVASERGFEVLDRNAMAFWANNAVQGKKGFQATGGGGDAGGGGGAAGGGGGGGEADDRLAPGAKVQIKAPEVMVSGAGFHKVYRETATIERHVGGTVYEVKFAPGSIYPQRGTPGTGPGSRNDLNKEAVKVLVEKSQMALPFKAGSPVVPHMVDASEDADDAGEAGDGTTGLDGSASGGSSEGGSAIAGGEGAKQRDASGAGGAGTGEVIQALAQSSDALPSDTKQKETRTMADDQTFTAAEIETKIETARKAAIEEVTNTFAEQLKTEKDAREASEAEAVTLKGSVAELQKANRSNRFTEMVTGRGGANDGAPWVGDAGKHVEMLESLASKFSEEDPLFVQYVESQTAAAQQVKEANLFAEIGTASGAAVSDPERRLDQLTEERLKTHESESQEQAYAEVLKTAEGRKLYAQIPVRGQ